MRTDYIQGRNSRRRVTYGQSWSAQTGLRQIGVKLRCRALSAAGRLVGLWRALTTEPVDYCPTCDRIIPPGEVFREFDFQANGDMPAHEPGEEVQVGGDGYGGRCSALMDVPVVHFLERRP